MSVVDEVKERLDIVEVIQSYVPLKKAGRNYKGLCPFHAEKTPSFVVFPETGTWHCFGACGTGGDVFSFVMKRENMGFGEALRLLARRAGVELEPPSPQATEAERRLDVLREINQAAATYFFHRLLQSDEAARARSYLEGRGLSRETIERFQVGYALDRWDGLLRYLGDKGYALQDLHEAGLIVEREDGSGYYDRFRGRVIVPIRDQRGRTIGFGGRILGEGVPKYLNSPQTPLFDKSSVLFGLDQARAGIRTSGVAVIVEGYMDVLMAHQHGINNVVAQMGTALTEAQLRLLKRLTQRFVLALDSDTAGDQATLRGLDVAREVMDREVVPVPTARGLIRFEERLAADIHIVSLPEGRDPDEVIRESPAQWVQLVANAKPVMDYYFDALSADLDLTTAKGKADVVSRLGPLVAELSDRVQRAHYLQQLGRMVQVDEAALWQQIRQAGGHKQPPRHGQGQQPAEPSHKAGLGLDEHCLSFALHYPHLLAQADEALGACEEEPLAAGDLGRPEDRVILDTWRAWLKGGGSRQARGEFFDALDERLQDRVTVLVAAQEARPPLPEELLGSDVLDAVIRLRLQNLRREVQSLRYLLEDPEDAAAAATYGPLIIQTTARIRRLQQALNERSLSGRRQQKDAAVRVPFGEE
ncbi:MAG: DNA primase [Chloroflexia bacterium]|nr:DNA primase [Chloroflexia bacterium]